MSFDLATRAEPTSHRRSVPLVDFEFRADDGAASWTFEGVACTVDHPYAVRDWMGEYTETIADGAFNRSIADPGARISLHANHQHGKAVPFATRAAGTLEVVADPHLRLRADLDPSRADVQILRSALRRGEMTEMSIGFSDVKGGAVWSEDFTERTVNDLRLREASIVEDGCNELTEASIRSLTQELHRYNTVDADPDEVRRAIAWLTSLLPVDLSEPDDIARSGMVVSDHLLELWARRFVA